MEEPDSFNKPRLLIPDPTTPIHPNPSKSYSLFLCKSLFVALLLVLLPLFPSKAPEFINQSILTKFWELLHLLVIGIVVSYGLFGRKNTQPNNENQLNFDDSKAYLSGILYVPSIFEDGYERYDEKRTIQAWNNGIGSSVLDELNNPRSNIFQNGLENPFGSDEKRVSQTWNSQYYFQGESMPFVSRENCLLDEWGKPKSFNDNKPLNLPVRSLRSRIVDHDTLESIKENGSISDSKGSCKNYDKIRDDSKGGCENSENFGNGTEFRGLAPINLDEKFKETVEVREDHMSSVKPPSHSRPLSVGGFEFDHLKSQSFWSPIFSQTNSMPSPPKKVSPDVRYSKIEDLEREKSSCCLSLLPDSLRNGEASSLATNARRFSIGSLSEMNVERNCEDKLKGFSKSMREDSLGKRKFEVDSLKGKFVKPLQRGKSVRTIRASEHCLETRKMAEIYSDHVDDKFEAMSMENSGRRARLGQPRRQNLEDLSLKQSKSSSSSSSSSKLSNCAETNVVEPEKDPDSDFESFQVSSDEGGEEEKEEEEKEEKEEEELDAKLDQLSNANDAELDLDSEVDKKASEFIAKFREQIRLQKIASTKGFSGL
ncbi:uncharacterized protein LOC114273770 [Camellia sinensis]|uniref:DUF4408 domain-containing protein n=1 Tax=Camellia sinensis var. sinensis TaxID=542762 RepID=A0A4S4EI86_CAMSN|nr:uncharacterized protein LOC114273770 [Camellia sinensis]THG16221.1 hypothetical protein TEA_008580 [Camellia sinensis var. sinensis]